MSDAWSEISASTDINSNNLRRADPRHPLEFWRGRDSRGRYLFVLEGSAPPDGFPHYDSAGIELTITEIANSQYRLTLTLADSDLVELFRALCSDLLSATVTLTKDDSAEGVSVVLYRLQRWQDMLARRRSDILSDKEIIGLIGEIMLLRDLLMPEIPARAAINCWRGPYGDEQDFIINGVIIEVKTQLATSDRRISISSEDQLDTVSGRIILCQQGLGIALSSVTEARSLNSLISETGKLIKGQDIAAYDLFLLGLLEVGYENRVEYDTTYYILNDRVFYDVRDGFPRIKRSDLISGVEEVKYRIRINDCQPFLINVEKTIKELINE